MSKSNYTLIDRVTFSAVENNELNEVITANTAEMTKLDYIFLANTFMLETSTQTYLKLGLREEIGEIAGVLKKTIRGDKLKDDALKQEIGDVMWYWAALIFPIVSNPYKYTSGVRTSTFSDKAKSMIGKGISTMEDFVLFYESEFGDFNFITDYSVLSNNESFLDNLAKQNDITLIDTMLASAHTENYSSLFAALLTFCRSRSIDLQECAMLNLAKLFTRQNNNTLISDETEKGEDER